MAKIGLYRDPGRGRYEYQNGFSVKTYRKALYGQHFMEYDNFDKCFTDNKNTNWYYYLIYLPEFQFFSMPESVEIPKKVIADIKRGKCKILLANVLEGFAYEKYYDPFIKGVIAKYDILQESHFVILSANMGKSATAKTVYYNGWESMAIHTYNVGWLQDGYDSVDREKDYTYICLNRRPHAHRLAMFLELYEHTSGGILTQWPNSGGPYMVRESSKKAKVLFRQTAKLFDKHNLEQLLPVTYPGDVDADAENPICETGVQADKYLNSYIHFVSETFFDGSGLFFSEKTFKPILYFQPWVMIGQHHSVKALREMGYDVFDDQIDHSYDEEKDHEKRFYMVRDEMIRLSNIDKETLYRVNKENRLRYFNNMATLFAREKEQPLKLILDLQDAFFDNEKN